MTFRNSLKLLQSLKLLRTWMVVLLATLSLSSAVLADPPQRRGKFRDRGDWRDRDDRRDRKAEKFINGHDARDGRWDGRGPRNRRRDRWDDCDRCDDDWRDSPRRRPSRRWPRR